MSEAKEWTYDECEADNYLCQCKTQWRDANLVKPEKSCLAFYLNSLNKTRLVKAFYVKKFEMEADIYWDEGYEGCDYDEESDTYYVTEGWYEEIDNWDDLSFISITEGTVTHWMPLPVMPEIDS